jgi:MFS family permease
VAAALASAVILGIIAIEFPEPAERTKAMSLYTFVVAGGASLGLLLGGILTQAISWHWIFFVNLPIGAVAFFLGRSLIVENEGLGREHGIDWVGSILITAASVAGIYALIKVPVWGWTGDRTLVLAGVSALLLAAFIAFEARVSNPIMPLRVFAIRSLLAANLVRGFMVTGAYSVFFLGALYLEHVRHYDALEIGLAFMAMSIAVGTMSAGVTARLVTRFGAKPVLLAGIASGVTGLALFSQAGESTSYFPLLFTSLALVGLGFGAAIPPLMTIAMEEVPAADVGLASGTVQVSIQLSAAVGLAALGTVATDRTQSLAAAGQSATASLSGGFHLAFLIAAGIAALAIAVAVFLLPSPQARPELVEPEEDADRLTAEALGVAEAEAA